MSMFAEYLERLKNEQDLSISQIGEMANVDASTLFRWMSGQSLPDNWDIPDWAPYPLIRQVIGEGVPPEAVRRFVSVLNIGR